MFDGAQLCTYMSVSKGQNNVGTIASSSPDDATAIKLACASGGRGDMQLVVKAQLF